MQVEKNDIILKLKREVLALQGFKRPSLVSTVSALGPIENAFPNQSFPTGAVHEFLSPLPEYAAATNGFITALLSILTSPSGMCLWISNGCNIFPPALKLFAINPDRVIFINTAKHKQALWTIEEGLKCPALAAVIGEVRELSFTESRRLQLAVKESKVTGLIHRHNYRNENTVACVSRWKIKPIHSVSVDGLPGLGFPRWNVQLQKVRNGRPGNWNIEWSAGRFQYDDNNAISISTTGKLKAG